MRREPGENDEGRGRDAGPRTRLEEFEIVTSLPLAAVGGARRRRGAAGTWSVARARSGRGPRRSRCTGSSRTTRGAVSPLPRPEAEAGDDRHGRRSAPGTRLGELEIDRVLGAGGFGVTYRTRDLSLDAWRAVKEYLPRDWGTRRPDGTVGPRSDSDAEDYYGWGLERFWTMRGFWASSGAQPTVATERTRDDPLRPLSEAAAGGMSSGLASAVDAALSVHAEDRPRSLEEWRGLLDGGVVGRGQSNDRHGRDAGAGDAAGGVPDRAGAGRGGLRRHLPGARPVARWLAGGEGGTCRGTGGRAGRTGRSARGPVPTPGTIAGASSGSWTRPAF